MVTKREVEEIVDIKLSEQTDLIQQGFNDVRDEIHREVGGVRQELKVMSFNIARILDLLGDQKGEIKQLKSRMDRFEQAYPLPA